jgi:hypothetical protein
MKDNKLNENLIRATKNGLEKVAIDFIVRGADTTYRDEEGNTPLNILVTPNNAGLLGPDIVAGSTIPLLYFSVLNGNNIATQRLLNTSPINYIERTIELAAQTNHQEIMLQIANMAPNVEEIYNIASTHHYTNMIEILDGRRSVNINTDPTSMSSEWTEVKRDDNIRNTGNIKEDSDWIVL